MPCIERDSNFKDVQTFMKEVKDRIKYIQKETVKSITDAAIEAIQQRSPHDLKQYEQDLENAAYLQDQLEHIVYAITYQGKFEKITEQDPNTTLLYVRKTKRKAGQKWAKAFRILQEYGPFTVDTWPVRIPKEKGLIFYRRVSSVLVAQVASMNQAFAEDLSGKLRHVGVQISKEDFKFNRDKIDVMNDLAYEIIRREKGIMGKAEPHWKAGINSVRTKELLDEIKKKDGNRILRTANDIHFRDYKNLGKIKNKVSAKELKRMEKFQKSIMGM